MLRPTRSNRATSRPPTPIRPTLSPKVPFYKRELSFRRRKTDVEPEPVVAEVAAEPVFEEPAAEEIVTEEPLAEEPVAVEAVPEEPVVEPSPVEEPVAFELVPDEPLAEEPFIEPVNENPVVDEPVAFEPVADDFLVAEPVDEELLAEELLVEEPFVEEPIADEPVADERLLRLLSRLPLRALAAFTRKRNGSAPGAKSPKRGRGNKAKTIVGLKIGTSQIAAAVMSDNDGRHELVHVARRPIESGLVVDGEIRDVDALAHQLKAFFERGTTFRGKNVRIGLSSNRIGVRTFDIAGIDDATRFDNAVRFKAHEVLPVAQHESVLDYRVLSERPAEDGATVRRILLVVAPRDQVEPYVNVARQAEFSSAVSTSRR